MIYILAIVLAIFVFWMAKHVLEWMIKIALIDMHLYDPDWRVRWMFRELPGNMYHSEEEARRIAIELLTDFPGPKNDAITMYLLGEHSAYKMEEKLNARCALFQTKYSPKEREFL